MSTIRQKKAVTNLVQNGGNVTKAMKDAGYRDSTAHTPKKLTQATGFKEVMKPIADQLKQERDNAIQELRKKIFMASYSDLVDAIDKLTKNIRLIEERSTENLGVNNFSHMSNEELSTIIERNKKEK